MTTTIALSQTAFGFYEDGTETGATRIGSISANLSRDILQSGALLGLRVRLQETNGVAGLTTDDYQLQYSLNGGTYANVTTSTTGVKAFNSANLTDQNATTNRLGAGTGSFVAGLISEDGLADNKQITASNYCEFLYAIQLVPGDLALNDTIDFRVLRNASTITYTVTPRITITGGLGTDNIVVTGYLASNTASDLTGAGQNKALVTSGVTSGSWSSQSIGANGSATASFFTPAGDPGTNGLSTYAITPTLNVTTGNVNLRYGARALRVNSSGVVQAEGSYAETASGAAGLYTPSPNVTGLGTWNSGDRLRIDVRARNTTANTAQSFVLEYSASTGVEATWSNSASKWNYDEKSVNVTLSGSDLIATDSLLNSNYDNVRATVTQLSGGSTKVYYEVTPAGIGANPGEYSTGVSAHAFSTLSSSGGFLGSTVNSLGWFADGTVYTNNALNTTIASYTNSDLLSVAVDFSNKKIWFRVSGGNWNNNGSADPASNVGGIDITALGATYLYATAGLNALTGQAHAQTVNFDGPFTYTSPSGYTKFDGTSISIPINAAQTLEVVSESSTVNVIDTFSGPVTLTALTQASTVNVTDKVDGAQTLAISQSVTVNPIDTVTAAQTLVVLSSSGTVKSIDTVSGPETLAISQSATSAVVVTETTAQTLSALNQSATINETDKIDAAQTLAAITFSGTSIKPIDTTTAAQTLVAVSSSGTVQAIDTETGGELLTALNQSSTVNVIVTETAAQTLSLQQSATVKPIDQVSAAQTLTLNQSATDNVIDTVNGAETLVALNQSATITFSTLISAAQTVNANTSGTDNVLDQFSAAQTLSLLQSATINPIDTQNGSQTLSAITQGGTINAIDLLTGAQTLSTLQQSCLLNALDTFSGNQTLSSISASGDINLFDTVNAAQTFTALNQHASIATVFGPVAGSDDWLIKMRRRRSR